MLLVWGTRFHSGSPGSWHRLLGKQEPQTFSTSDTFDQRRTGSWQKPLAQAGVVDPPWGYLRDYIPACPPLPPVLCGRLQPGHVQAALASGFVRQWELEPLPCLLPQGPGDLGHLCPSLFCSSHMSQSNICASREQVLGPQLPASIQEEHLSLHSRSGMWLCERSRNPGFQTQGPHAEGSLGQVS